MIATVFAAGWLLAGIVVCHLCGREAAPGAAECGHCGAELEQTAAGEEPAGIEADEPSVAVEPGTQESSFLDSGKLEFLGLGLVESEFNMVRQALEQDRKDLAGHFLRHALALERLARPDESGRRRFAMQSYKSRTETSDRRTRHVCPVCDGQGRMRIKYRTISGAVKHRDMQGKLCPLCGVRGYIVRPVPPDAWRQGLETAQKVYEDAQERRGRIKAGRAWLPPDLAPRLTLEQQAELGRALAAPCGDCAGLGLVECGECNSAGLVNCADCQMGRQTVDVQGEISRRHVVRTQACAECEASGALPCPHCDSEGRVACASCEGTGERAECTGCEGHGIADCRRCRGEGTRRGAECDACAGAGETLCSNCEGDGKAP